MSLRETEEKGEGWGLWMAMVVKGSGLKMANKTSLLCMEPVLHVELRGNNSIATGMNTHTYSLHTCTYTHVEVIILHTCSYEDNWAPYLPDTTANPRINLKTTYTHTNYLHHSNTYYHWDCLIDWCEIVRDYWYYYVNISVKVRWQTNKITDSSLTHTAGVTYSLLLSL